MLPARISVEAIVTELRGEHPQHTPHLSWPLRKLLIGISFVLGWRDFAATASLTLLSIYLQKAHHYTTKQAGFAVGGMMLLGVLSNPLAVYLSGGKRRLPTLAAVLILGGLTILPVPMLPVAWVLPVMCIFQCFQLGSYAVSDAAMLERVSPMVRGRVVGLFLTLAGPVAAISPSIMGYWTDHLGDRARQPGAYWPLFATLSAMMVVASASTVLIAKLGGEEAPV